MADESKPFVAVADAAALTEPVAFPVVVSDDGRHFVNRAGQAVFWLGTTQWQLFRGYTAEDAAVIIDRTRAHGFVFAQVMLLGVRDGTDPNVYGHTPWLNDDPLTPNEAYFENVDRVLEQALRKNLAISMTIYHQRYRDHLTLEKARPWAAWLARRYGRMPHIVWSMTPRAEQAYVPVLRELAARLGDGDADRRLTTFKPDPSPFSSSFLHAEPWLDFNAMQTWKEVGRIYPFIAKDYSLQPVKPVLMAEGAYEAGTEYGFDVTPLWVRRQAYYSYLAGAHHTYGHNDSWRVLETWRQSLDAPGAVQMGLLKRIFLARDEWWKLVPDQDVFAAGGCTEGALLHLAARHREGRWVMVYLADKASFSIKMDKIAAPKATAFWIDPRTGDSRAAGVHAARGVREFATPDRWDDALLVLQGEPSR